MHLSHELDLQHLDVAFLLLELGRCLHLLLEQRFTDGEYLRLHALVSGRRRHALALLTLDSRQDRLGVVNHDLILLEDLLLLARGLVEETGRHKQLLEGVLMLLLLVEFDLGTELLALGAQFGQVQLQPLDLKAYGSLAALHHAHQCRGLFGLQLKFSEVLV